MRRSSYPLLFVLLSMLVAQPVAAIVTVGPGPDCQFPNVQAAIGYVLFYERNHPDGVDPYIAVAAVDEFGNQAVYASEALTVDSSGIGTFDVFGQSYDHAFVQIYGDYDADCQAEINNGNTGLRAYVGAPSGHSVLDISGSSVVQVVINHLEIAGARGADTGGGINFHGRGYLELTNTEINDNVAAQGAGISADGHAISVILHGGTFIHDNTANGDGAGIRIVNETHLYALDSPILVKSNHAAGAGGGLLVAGTNSRADIGSPGWFSEAVISGNDAFDGGGVAVQDNGIVRLFATVPGAPARIEGNVAFSRGGGVLADAQNDGHTYGTFCAWGYGINANTSDYGSAIAAVSSGDGEIGGRVLLLRDSRDLNICGVQPAAELGAVECGAGATCNSISRNVDNSASGPLFAAESNAVINLERAAIQSNRGGQIVFASGGVFTARNALFTNDSAQGVPFFDDSQGAMKLDGCTIANNLIGTNQLFLLEPGGRLDIVSTLIAATTGLTVNRQGGTLNVQDVIAPEIASLTTNALGGNVLQVADPKFVDAFSGNYHLLSSSPAVDFAASSDLASDLEGRPRGVDLVPAPNRAGGFDIGAYELQTYTPCFENDRIFCSGFEP